MIHRRSAAIALCWLSCSAAIAKDYSDEECQKGSKGMTLRLVRIVEDHDKTGRLERNGIFEIGNNGNRARYCGDPVRGGFSVGMPDASLQIEVIDGVWQNAIEPIIGTFSCEKMIEVRHGMKPTLVIDINWSPDILSYFDFGDLKLKMPYTFRVFLRDFDHRACVASDPFTLPQ